MTLLDHNYYQRGPLAQSVERRADNAKVVRSRLTWTNFFFENADYIVLARVTT